MAKEDLWSAFAKAIVRVELPFGTRVLRPMEGLVSQVFPFASPVHIVTAFNPNGIVATDDANWAAHQQLVRAVIDYRSVQTVGSAEDGKFPEPGLAIEGLDLASALELGEQFGQVAIYRWTALALTICGVGEPVELALPWRLDDPFVC